MSRLAALNLQVSEREESLCGIGDLFFSEGYYERASVYYQQLSVLASSQVNAARDAKSVPQQAHFGAYALSRYARCLLHARLYKPALAQAEVGRSLSFYDDLSDTKYQIYFAQVIGVSGIRIYGKGTELTNDYLEKFVGYIDRNGTGGESQGEIAVTMTEVADAYCFAQQWEKASELYKRSAKLWNDLASPTNYLRRTKGRISTDTPIYERLSYEERLPILQEKQQEAQALSFAKTYGEIGLYNSCLAYIRTGQALLQLDDLADARANFDIARVKLDACGAQNSILKAKVLLSLARIDWSSHRHFEALSERVEALKMLRRVRYVPD
jgi:hypothetical protein